LNRYTALFIAMALGALVGCHRSQPSVTIEPVVAEDGISWYPHSIRFAIAEPANHRKPLLSFFGAEWWPYCQTLKKTVLTRRDFIEKTKLFIPVYVDADMPDAHAWRQQLKVSGYPTLLVLRPDGAELARLSGGMDLSLYAALLDEAIRDERPIL